ncbi:hypothetical protein C8R44DRAFT_195624 [Mycena epipterygia]|nr:hypothetical protein C8R44DRAFT_195624 [Mycena epipterygia]
MGPLPCCAVKLLTALQFNANKSADLDFAGSVLITIVDVRLRITDPNQRVLLSAGGLQLYLQVTLLGHCLHRDETRSIRWATFFSDIAMHGVPQTDPRES